MSDSELAQLELFAQIDELVRRLQQWSQGESPWEPLNQSRALVRRLLTRLETLRIRLEAPLVVATFGGTGTGKSSLVNALVGTECTKSGRQRPTTTKPVLIAQSGAELQTLNLPLEQFEIVRVESSVLRDVVILDCPDPDTSEEETAGSNLEMLRRVLPHCDVLLYASTQQKYRSARVLDELDVASAGCRLIFVQTHADTDEDIRGDWRKLLGERYEVPDVFFVDSVTALTEQQSGQRPSGDFAKLQDLLTTRLAVVQRIQIRRANLLDLTSATLAKCREQLGEFAPAVATLEDALVTHRQKLTREMSRELKSQLGACSHLWERRILSEVTTLWGTSPFSTLLRVYSGLGALLTSASLYRARSGAQLALIGAMQGTRWLTARQRERSAEGQFEELATLGIDQNLVREARLLIGGHVLDARLDPSLVDSRPGEDARLETARFETGFLENAKQQIDETIERLAKRNSGILARAWYELLLLSFVGFVLYRAGRNFFWDTARDPLVKILPIDFYVSAGLFFALWAVILVMSFCRRLKRGLASEITTMASEMAEQKLTGGLFPHLESALQSLHNDRRRLDEMTETCRRLRGDVATSPDLGSPRQLNAETITAAS
ncbi:MAG: 50S ribosome-binding GTPase [Rhodopirellula sp.]|nr:50S ribosome-binding GTPase [Rhodopirellula sp.]